MYVFCAGTGKGNMRAVGVCGADVWTVLRKGRGGQQVTWAELKIGWRLYSGDGPNLPRLLLKCEHVRVSPLVGRRSGAGLMLLVRLWASKYMEHGLREC